MFDDDNPKAAQARLTLLNAIDDADRLPGCISSDPEAWFSEGRGDTDSYAWAKKICAACPVKKLCLDYALIAELDYGIFGGTTASQRKKMRQLKRKKTPTE